jgi:hypothetical protein
MLPLGHHKLSGTCRGQILGKQKACIDASLWEVAINSVARYFNLERKLEKFRGRSAYH